MNAFVNNLNSNEVYQLLSSLDEKFTEHLSSYIDIKSYSIKLANFAKFVIVQNNNATIGVLAFYTDNHNKELYIPYLCVSSKHRRMGVADELMQCICKYADCNFLSIKLEVRIDNEGAIQLYKKYGFVIIESSDNKSKMLRNYIS